MKNNYIPGIIFKYIMGPVILLFGSKILFFLTNKYGDVGEIIGSIIIGLAFVFTVYTLVGGNLEQIKKNQDIRGKKYSWKNTLIGLIVFILSIPLVIILTLYLFGYL